MLMGHRGSGRSTRSLRSCRSRHSWANPTAGPALAKDRGLCKEAGWGILELKSSWHDGAKQVAILAATRACRPQRLLGRFMHQTPRAQVHEILEQGNRRELVRSGQSRSS